MPAPAPLMPQATACCCQALLGQALGSRCAALRSRPAPAARPRRQAVRAAQAGGRKEGAAAGGGRLRPWWREKVTFLVPDHAQPGRTVVYPFVHVTQRTLSNLLDKTGTVGFRMTDGDVSDQLADLPEGGTVELVLPRTPAGAEQVHILHKGFDNDTQAMEHAQRLAAFLRQLASSEKPGCSISTLQTEPFKDSRGQDFVQFDAAVVADDTLYVAELRRTLGMDSVIALLVKQVKISPLPSSTSPDLEAALHGATHVKLFLAGEGVRAGLLVEDLAQRAAGVDVGLVLPSGQGLGLVVTPSAKPL